MSALTAYRIDVSLWLMVLPEGGPLRIFWFDAQKKVWLPYLRVSIRSLELHVDYPKG
jgi:hypothetical protein